MVLVPPLNRGSADLVGPRELAQCDTAIMRLIHLKSVRFRGTITGPDTFKGVAKIAPAGLAVVLGYPQIQGHHLVTLAGVLHGPLMSGFDP
jgi:hypothetical protein